MGIKRETEKIKLIQRKETRIEMRKSIALIFLMMLSSLSATDKEEGAQIVRRTRDGNMGSTGCEELDSFINNLSDFTTKIVNMFYGGNKSENNDLEDTKSKEISEKKAKDSDDLVHVDLLPISKNT